jgi:hypothetical protein
MGLVFIGEAPIYASAIEFGSIVFAIYSLCEGLQSIASVAIVEVAAVGLPCPSRIERRWCRLLGGIQRNQLHSEISVSDQGHGLAAFRAEPPKSETGTIGQNIRCRLTYGELE